MDSVTVKLHTLENVETHGAVRIHKTVEDLCRELALVRLEGTTEGTTMFQKNTTRCAASPANPTRLSPAM